MLLPYIACMVKAGALRYVCEVPAPTKKLGYPRNDADIPLFGTYIDAIADVSEAYFDVILVDGRFRIACMLKAHEFMHPHSVALLHDSERFVKYFDDLRPYFHIQKHEKIRRLVAFRAKIGTVVDPLVAAKYRLLPGP